MADTALPLPVDGWDCHAHLFGPYARWPLADARSYTPPEAPREAYLALLDRLGLRHGVLVHPSAYGADHGLLLDALAASPRLRGVAVLQAGAPLPRPLKALRAAGVRGARFSARSGGANFAGSASLEDLEALAPALADAGLHAELWTDVGALPDIAPRLARLPVPVVIDHMAGFDADAGIDQPGWRVLRELLAGGRTWVKLCAYRNLLGRADPSAGRAFHTSLLATRPDRLVWGSDWPHLRVAPAPDTAALLGWLQAWTPDAAQARALLHDNPQALYA